MVQQVLGKRSICLVFAVLALLPEVARAGVQIGVGPNGRKIIFNENLTQRARRLSSRLQPARHSQAQSLDPRLVRALIQAESGYNRRALSNKGAMGLMQLMPETASELRVGNPYDADENLRGGTTYLRALIDRFAGRVELAVAAYNAGPGAVERHRGIPPFAETRDYVRRVLALYRGADLVGTAAAQAAVPAPGRRKPYWTRDRDNRLVITTALGGQR